MVRAWVRRQSKAVLKRIRGAVQGQRGGGSGALTVASQTGAAAAAAGSANGTNSSASTTAGGGAQQQQQQQQAARQQDIARRLSLSLSGFDTAQSTAAGASSTSASSSLSWLSRSSRFDTAQQLLLPAATSTAAASLTSPGVRIALGAADRDGPLHARYVGSGTPAAASPSAGTPSESSGEMSRRPKVPVGAMRAKLEAAALVPPNPLRWLADVRVAGALALALVLVIGWWWLRLRLLHSTIAVIALGAACVAVGVSVHDSMQQSSSAVKQ